MSVRPPRLEAGCLPHSAAGGVPENLIDAAVLFAGCGGNPVLFAKMVQSFHAHVGPRLCDLRDAVRQRDLSALRLAAHKLRGFIIAFSRTTADAILVLEETDAEEQPTRVDEQFAAVAAMIRTMQKSLETLSVDDLQRQLSSDAFESAKPLDPPKPSR